MYVLNALHVTVAKEDNLYITSLWKVELEIWDL